MQTDTIGGTIAALLTMADEARRSAASLQRYQTVHNHRDFAALHRLALVTMELGQAILQAEAALTPQARSAIAELVS